MELKNEWPLRADRIGHWNEGPETFVIVKAKDLQLGTQTYGPPLVDLPGLDSKVVNEACWTFVESLPHQIPTPIWNDLKPALYAAFVYYHINVMGARGQPVQGGNHGRRS